MKIFDSQVPSLTLISLFQLFLPSWLRRTSLPADEDHVDWEQWLRGVEAARVMRERQNKFWVHDNNIHRESTGLLYRTHLGPLNTERFHGGRTGQRLSTTATQSWWSRSEDTGTSFTTFSVLERWKLAFCWSFPNRKGQLFPAMHFVLLLFAVGKESSLCSCKEMCIFC